MAQYSRVFVTQCSCQLHYPVEAHILYETTNRERLTELLDQGIDEDTAIAQANLEALKLTISTFTNIKPLSNREIRYCCALLLRTGKGDSRSFPSCIGTPEAIVQNTSKLNYEPINEIMNVVVDKVGQSAPVYNMNPSQEQPVPQSRDESNQVIDFLRDENGNYVYVTITNGNKQYKVRVLVTTEVPKPFGH